MNLAISFWHLYHIHSTDEDRRAAIQAAVETRGCILLLGSREDAGLREG